LIPKNQDRCISGDEISRQISNETSNPPGSSDVRDWQTNQTNKESEKSGPVPAIDPEVPNPVSVVREFVFDDHRPFAQCHASTLASLPDGGLCVAWFGGTREGHSDVGIWSAERPGEESKKEASPAPPNAASARGTSWSEPRLIAKVSDDAHWNPVLFALSPSGSDLCLHFKVGARIRDWQTWTQRSTDAGRTWSAAQRLVPGDRGGRGAVKNKAIQLTSGDWIAGASIEAWRQWDSFIDRSPDGLANWVAGAKIEVHAGNFSGKGLIQPTLWESAPGRVHALFRSTDGRTHRSDSEDDGRTWSMAYPIDVPNNNSGLDLICMSHRLLALVCNPVAGNWAARTPLSLLLSGDNGRSWPERIEIETKPGEFSYPSIIETEAGLVISYTWNRRRIAVATIDTRALPRIR
jgi:predicted neuraminidase